jgi:MFS family permease
MSTAPRLFVGQLMLAVVVLQIGAGIQGVLLPYRAGLEGFPIKVIGLLGTAYYAGFVAGCLALPRLIGRIGHIRAFAGLAGLAAAGVLGHGLAVAEPSWIALRVGIGFCFAGIYMTIESWLNDRASDENRGRVLAI